MTVRRFPFAVALFSVASLASLAAAQEPSTPILNTLELRQALASGTPADLGRLAAHFTALADRYAADAKVHARMAQALTGTPKAPGASAHCKQLAAANQNLEAAARELATFHAKSAAGTAGAAPSDRAGLTTGVGARKPTSDEMEAFAAKAAEAGDHRALADYFTTLAKRYQADADAHTGMATMYRTSRTAGMVPHCERLARLAKGAAKEARTAAAMHTSLAGRRAS
jgi:hypothetical protein